MEKIGLREEIANEENSNPNGNSEQKIVRYKTLFILSFSFLFVASSLRGDIFYYENQFDWEANASTPIQVLDLFDANVVALANEVVGPPTDNELLGTSVLTFDSATTGFNSSFQLNLLESTDFQFQSSGSRLGLEPSSSSQEDFEQLIGGSGTFALAMQLEEHQASNTVWEFFDAANNSLGSVVLSNGGGGAQFYGVVSDIAIVRAVVTHSASENFGIGTQYFSDSAAIPEPSGLTALCGVTFALIGCRRRRSK